MCVGEPNNLSLAKIDNEFAVRDELERPPHNSDGSIADHEVLQAKMIFILYVRIE